MKFLISPKALLIIFPLFILFFNLASSLFGSGIFTRPPLNLEAESPELKKGEIFYSDLKTLEGAKSCQECHHKRGRFSFKTLKGLIEEKKLESQIKNCLTHKERVHSPLEPKKIDEIVSFITVYIKGKNRL